MCPLRWPFLASPTRPCRAPVAWPGEATGNGTDVGHPTAAADRLSSGATPLCGKMGGTTRTCCSGSGDEQRAGGCRSFGRSRHGAGALARDRCIECAAVQPFTQGARGAIKLLYVLAHAGLEKCASVCVLWLVEVCFWSACGVVCLHGPNRCHTIGHLSTKKRYVTNESSAGALPRPRSSEVCA